MIFPKFNVILKIGSLSYSVWVDCIKFIKRKRFFKNTKNSSLQKWKSIFASTNVKNCCFHAFWKCVMFTMLNAKEKTSQISLFSKSHKILLFLSPNKNKHPSGKTALVLNTKRTLVCPVWNSHVSLICNMCLALLLGIWEKIVVNSFFF